eukprot:CAMPEP_0194750452 /NCGR_PEP_ID=MMETSP0323_2-20130528/4514_1 /TAXON_ID=2866 ORGANISM="Crypthecodinium cohnii, Strain Seligo" /NCGR_SAMPLE_ID=MMETSP0323_2 /ASSEMBLY_ACC=CAM_ASM_000346 /LENGTH=124 /DNA_ID=CAMNT_0039666181 /DNA_START=146 /DNA_END=520 /DNA_ORIENTATION=+
MTSTSVFSGSSASSSSEHMTNAVSSAAPAGQAPTNFSGAHEVRLLCLSILPMKKFPLLLELLGLEPSTVTLSASTSKEAWTSVAAGSPVTSKVQSQGGRSSEPIATLHTSSFASPPKGEKPTLK